jgi:hypothetical protein
MNNTYNTGILSKANQKVRLLLGMLLFFGIASNLVFAQGIEKTKRMRVAKIITIDIPSNFRQLTQAEVAQRYPSSRKQIAVFTSPNNTADIGINKGKTVWEEKDIALVRDFYRSTLESFYAKTTFERADIVEVHGKKFARLIFVGEIDGGNLKPKYKVYVHIRYCVIGKRLYIFQFNCQKSEAKLYQKAVAEIMDNIKISKKQADEGKPATPNNLKDSPRK